MTNAQVAQYEAQSHRAVSSASAPARATVASPADLDYERLARAMSAVRPVMENVTFQPYNYNEMMRQMADAQRLASVGGVPH